MGKQQGEISYHYEVIQEHIHVNIYEQSGTWPWGKEKDDDDDNKDDNVGLNR